MGNDAVLRLFRSCLYLRLENWDLVRVGSSALHELRHGHHLLGAARLLRPGTSRGLFCKYRDRLRRGELHERGIPPLSSPPLWLALDRDAHPYGAPSRQDARVRLLGLSGHGFYGAFHRVNSPSQNGCSRRETCPLGAHESPTEAGSAREENEARKSRIGLMLFSTFGVRRLLRASFSSRKSRARKMPCPPSIGTVKQRILLTP